MSEYDPERITYFAKTDARGKQVPFGIKAKDRTKHVYVIGKTGMGKSTLLENMAVQDIQNGEGLAFIDPHGQTAETLLDYIPEHRKKDVLYFAPFDMEHPVSFNVMEDIGADKRHLVASGLMSVFKKIFVDAWSARMEYILTNTLLALLEYPDATLLGVNRMLSDKVYRKKVIDNITDPAVKAFWVDEFLKYNERYMQEAGDAIKNKIGQFTANPLIRNIIGQPKSSFDIREMMDDRKIIIMNLSKGLIGETNANLLGSMLITRIYLAAMSRAELSPAEMDKMSNFYFYVDEFQSFANEAFANILSEARKYKLNLTIAHQYIEQMEEEVRNAVFGNVGTTISFRVGPFDAEVLETIFQPQFYAVDICNLGFAQVYLTLMIDGVGSLPFSAVTLPPIETESVSCKDIVIHNSREQFSHSRVDVEAAITKWHGVEESKNNQSNQNNKNGNSGSTYTKPNTNNSNGNNTATKTAKPTTSYTNGNARIESKPANYSNGEQKTDIKKPHEKRSESMQNTERTYEKKSNQETPPKKESQNERQSTDSRKTYAPKKPAYTNNANGGHKKESNLNDLRDVLRGLSKKDTDSRSTTEKRNSTSVTPKTDASPAKENLKEALSGVLKESQKIEVTKEKVHIEVEKEVQTAVVQKTRPPRESVKATTQNNTSLQQKTTERPERSKNNLDPKELERMMRVTTSDRTPLK